MKKIPGASLRREVRLVRAGIRRYVTLPRVRNAVAYLTHLCNRLGVGALVPIRGVIGVVAGHNCHCGKATLDTLHTTLVLQEAPSLAGPFLVIPLYVTHLESASYERLTYTWGLEPEVSVQS